MFEFFPVWRLHMKVLLWLNIWLMIWGEDRCGQIRKDKSSSLQIKQWFHRSRSGSVRIDAPPRRGSIPDDPPEAVCQETLDPDQLQFSLRSVINQRKWWNRGSSTEGVLTLCFIVFLLFPSVSERCLVLSGSEWFCVVLFSCELLSEHQIKHQLAPSFPRTAAPPVILQLIILPHHSRPVGPHSEPVLHCQLLKGTLWFWRFWWSRWI